MVSNAGPGRHLPVFQALLITLGMVITTDILKTAPTVALNVGPSLQPSPSERACEKGS